VLSVAFSTDGQRIVTPWWRPRSSSSTHSLPCSQPFPMIGVRSKERPMDYRPSL